jgi:nucleoside-diphosphate-sugar epimerase
MSISSADQHESGATHTKPLVVITGAAGHVGTALIAALSDKYRIVGLDVEGKTADCEMLAVDLSSDSSVEAALRDLADRYGKSVASVIHLAAYFDFTGEDNPLYRSSQRRWGHAAC